MPPSRRTTRSAPSRGCDRGLASLAWGDTSNRNTNPNAKFIKEITVSELKERNLSTLPFDRVLVDLLACARQVKRFQIINGLKPQLLEPALRGEHVGTIVRKDAP